MKDLTSSLRALADFLDREEFERVPSPDLQGGPPFSTQAVWRDLEGKRILHLFMKWHSGPVYVLEDVRDRDSFDPTAPQLPQPLLAALEALKKP